jgi:hypothetical protein
VNLGTEQHRARQRTRNQVTTPVSQKSVWIMDASMRWNDTPVTASCESLIDDLAASRRALMRLRAVR